MVGVAVPVAVLGGGLRLAHAAEAADHLRESRAAGGGEAGVEVGEDFLAAGEVGVGWQRHGPQGDLFQRQRRQTEEVAAQAVMPIDLGRQLGAGPEAHRHLPAGLLGCQAGLSAHASRYHQDDLVRLPGARAPREDLAYRLACRRRPELLHPLALERKPTPSPASPHVDAGVVPRCAVMLNLLEAIAMQQLHAQALEVVVAEVAEGQIAGDAGHGGFG